MKRLCILLALAWQAQSALAADTALIAAVTQDYKAHLGDLFTYFHRNPELSFMEVNTAARLAKELRAAGFEVTEGVGRTGVVALMKNGPGPLVMLRADMDGLPVQEKSGLPYASTATQKDQDGNVYPVSHACGHDVHMTSLVGTARQMAARKAEWSGTLMLIGQPAEERIAGARAMRRDRLWERFGRPDYALAFHVMAGAEAGKLAADEGAPYSGSDTVEILVHGVGTHGASPHNGKDPVVLGAQIVLALQTIVSRELAPREPGLITVGSFHAGTKANIISDSAKLQITVRSESPETRKLLLDGIRRVALNTARAFGMGEDQLPEITMTSEPTPPTVNDAALARRVKQAWRAKLGDSAVEAESPRGGMGAEDFPSLTTDPHIPSVYFRVGGTSPDALAEARAGGAPVAGHHSSLFMVSPEPSVVSGVEASVVALLDLMKKG
jgi:hippurate hydrolase